MQKPVNKKILSKKVIETSRLHLTYADVYKKMYHLWTNPMDRFVNPVHGLPLWTTSNFRR